MKVEALGSRFVGTTVLIESEANGAKREARAALRSLALERGVSVILVGGVSAGDPLSPFYAALQELGGQVSRHGVPAHPGSMIWLAELGQSRLLGLPQCGMFAMATAADLILPRLLTGESLTRTSLAELAHGGVLGPEMRFRFPPYARDLDTPDG
jgi:molybdopterin biosynthesis enzyme